MAEDGPVGSVAEETARLLEALLAGAGEETGAGEPAHRTSPTPETPEAPEEPCPTCGHVAGPSHTGGSEAEVCHLCPVCQLLRVVRSVRPETLDRLADLAAAVTETLRDVAANRWRESGAGPPRAARAEVEDIPVDDEAR
jgi:hypothetical protein